MSGTPIARMTPQSAPRDAESLAKLGIFQLRVLIQDCGGIQDDAAKLAFAKMTPEQKVQLAQQLLSQFAPGGAPAQQNGMNGAPQMGMMPPPGMQAPPQQQQQMAPQQFQQPPMQQAPMQGYQQQPQFQPQPGFVPQQQMPPPQEANPQQLAAAATAAAGTTERTPSNKQTKKADPDLAANVLATLSQIAQAQQTQGQELLGAVRELQNAVAELQKPDQSGELKSALKQFNDTYAQIYNVMSQFDQRLGMVQMSTNLSIALTMYLAESVLGAPRDQILQMAAGDISTIQTLLSAAPGKG